MNLTNIVSSHDINARLEEIRAHCEAFFEALEEEEPEAEIHWGGEYQKYKFWSDRNPKLSAEETSLIELRSRVDHARWRYGVDFIRVTHFEEVMRKDVWDALSRCPLRESVFNCIDWDKFVAQSLHDYQAVLLCGEQYLTEF